MKSFHPRRTKKARARVYTLQRSTRFTIDEPPLIFPSLSLLRSISSSPSSFVVAYARASRRAYTYVHKYIYMFPCSPAEQTKRRLREQEREIALHTRQILSRLFAPGFWHSFAQGHQVRKFAGMFEDGNRKEWERRRKRSFFVLPASTRPTAHQTVAALFCHCHQVRIYIYISLSSIYSPTPDSKVRLSHFSTSVLTREKLQAET